MPCDHAMSRHPALFGIAFCLPRTRRRLGQPIVRRSDRALGAVQRQGIGAHAPRQARPHPIDEPRREIRLQRYRRGIARAWGLPDPEQTYLTGNLENIDDFSACEITRKEDWVDLYAKPYYFDFEADDRMNATAFGRSNPFGSKLSAIFSSTSGISA